MISPSLLVDDTDVQFRDTTKAGSHYSVLEATCCGWANKLIPAIRVLKLAHKRMPIRQAYTDLIEIHDFSIQLIAD